MRIGGYLITNPENSNGMALCAYVCVCVSHLSILMALLEDAQVVHETLLFHRAFLVNI